MASTANTEAITRTEFDAMIERTASRLAALEGDASPSSSRIDEEGRTTSGQSEAVTQNEFRLFKWVGTFFVAAVLGAFGVLYQQISDVRVEMRDLHNTVLRELYTQLDTQIGGLRREFGSLRQEFRTEIGGLRQEMKENHDRNLEEIGSLRERVVRVETLLVEGPRTES
ncbi:MAG: hypothetical protein OXU77_05600 [Gammaproteobacteria bacterium]|nr:hypothetical protein [Gammaproteobacteria bacterium]MDE0443247.1 hypothetical protein [Gammaproteobacteria bacterium]